MSFGDLICQMSVDIGDFYSGDNYLDSFRALEVIESKKLKSLQRRGTNRSAVLPS